MQGWLRIAPEGVRTKRDLQRWVARGFATLARCLPIDGARFLLCGKRRT